MKSIKAVFINVLGLLPSVLCLVYTHFRVLNICNIDWTVADIVRVLTGVVFDVSLVSLLLFVLCIGRKRIANTLTFVIFLIWGIVNVIYASYFNGYMPLEAITQTSELASLSLSSYIADAFLLSDSFYLLCCIILGISLYCGKRYNASSTKKGYALLLSSLVVLCLVYFVSLKLFFYENHFTMPNKNTVAQISLMPTRERLSLEPVLPIAQTGIIRGLMLPVVFRSDDNKTLTAEECKAIDEIWQKQKAKYKNSFVTANSKPYRQIVFIIAETYLASTVDMKFQGKEVTPFLNKLRRMQNVCYNDSMQSDTQLGNSSDGQFIYMTGLQPLRDRLTISEVQSSTFITLPKMLKQGGFKSYMTIPTQPTLWSQNKMSEVYGIDRLYSTCDIDKNSWMTDNEVFNLAESKGRNASLPNIHFILTVSTHGAYDKRKPETMKCNCYPKDFPANISVEFRNYLLACHYMDHEIERYFDALKKNQNAMENTLVVIASDHGWKDNTKYLPRGVDKDRISMIFANVPQRQDVYHGRISQIDVFTSLMDLLYSTNTIQQNKDSWFGLGNSIFRKGQSVNKLDTWKMSADIINSNYFCKRR